MRRYSDRMHVVPGPDGWRRISSEARARPRRARIALAFGVPVRRGARFAVAVAGARVGIGLTWPVVRRHDEVREPGIPSARQPGYGYPDGLASLGVRGNDGATMHDLIRTFSGRSNLRASRACSCGRPAPRPVRCSRCASLPLRRAASTTWCASWRASTAPSITRTDQRQMMDDLHSVMRSIRGETRPVRRNHLTVFREFIDQLDRIGNRQNKALTKGRRDQRGKWN